MARTHHVTRLLRLGSLLLAGLAGSIADAAGDEPVRPARVDQFGDPLPDGAVARMGSTRFRHPGLSDFAWLPDGKTIATVGSDRVVRWWDPATGRRTKAVALKKANGRLYAISPDGKLVAACGEGATTVSDAASGEVLATLDGVKSGLAQLVFSPDGKWLAVGAFGSQFTLWDWRAKKARPVATTFPKWAGGDSTFHCHFSPDSKLFVGGASSQVPLTMIDVTTGDKLHEIAADAATSTFTHDAKRLIVSSHSKGQPVLKVFDVATGQETAEFPLRPEDRYYSLAVSPDGRLLACGASDSSCLFDLTTGKVLHRLTGFTWGLAFSPDSKMIAASAWGNHLRFWDVATGKERHQQPGNFGSYLATATSPDGRLVAAADWIDRAVHLWDTATGKRVGQFPLKGEGRYTRDLTFSTDGQTLAAGLSGGTVQVWEVATGRETRVMQLGDVKNPAQRPGAYHYSIRLSADGRRLATVERVLAQAESTRLTVWDLDTGRPLRDRTFPGERRRCAWSFDGDTLALGLDAGVVLIDLDTLEERARLEGSAPGSIVVAMSPDGRLAASRRGDPAAGAQSVGVYEVATGKPVATIPARGDFAIGRDNRTLFIADATHLRAWDLATGKEVARRPIPETWMDTKGQATISQIVPLDGRRVFTSLIDGTGLVWDFAPAPPAGGQADEKQLTAWWADLKGEDAAKAYAAVWRLAATAPDAVVPFLGRHLRPEAAPDPKVVQKLLSDLDSDSFRVREQAAKDLGQLGHAAAPALQRALAAKPAPETTRRIEQLLARKPDVASRPDLVRRLRAMQVLERVGTPEARAVLSALADGLPLAPETRAARAALAGR